MDKSIVLNICGVKSLGGQVIVKSALKFIEKSNYKIILLHDNYLLDNLDINSTVQKIETSLNRYFHPYLNIFLSKKDMNMINESEAIIHFGNFGFKTKNKSYALIQNLLPLKVKDLKNLILRYFINKSFKESDHIIYQLDHVAEEIQNQFSNKLIKIGVIEKFANDINSETGVISIQSQIKNKNSSFMDAVLKKLKVDNPNLKITKFISEENQKDQKINQLYYLKNFLVTVSICIQAIMKLLDYLYMKQAQLDCLWWLLILRIWSILIFLIQLNIYPGILNLPLHVLKMH